MERVKWIDKKKISFARKSGRRKNDAGTDKEEENKLTGPLAKKELPPEGCSRTGTSKLRPAGPILPDNMARLSRMILVIFWFGF